MIDELHYAWNHFRLEFRIARISLLLLCVSCFSGCQSLKPFQKASDKVSSAKQMAQQWTSKGLDALKTGSLSQAKSWFSRAAAENPDNLATQINLARVFRKEGNLQKAIEHMRQGVEFTPNSDPALIVELGEMYLEAGQWQTAEGLVAVALQRDHRFAPAWALQGHVLRTKGDSGAALANYHRAISLDSDLPDVQLAIAQINLESKEPLRALSAIEQFLHGLPADQHPEVALLTKGRILMDLNQEKTAIETFQTAVARDGASADAFIQLSQAQWKSGLAAEARATLVRGREIHARSAGHFNSILEQLETAQDRMASRE